MRELKEREKERNDEALSRQVWWYAYKWHLKGFFLLLTLIIAVGCPYGAAYLHEKGKVYRDDLESYQIAYKQLEEERNSKKREFLKAIEEKKEGHIRIYTLQKYIEHEGLTILRLEEEGKGPGNNLCYEVSLQGSFPSVISFIGDFHRYFPFASLQIKSMEGHEGLVKLDGLCTMMEMK